VQNNQEKNLKLNYGFFFFKQKAEWLLVATFKAMAWARK
jgi:hypothetical protein